MKYISSKELSKKWEISTKRITVLAKEGRIEGTKQIDGRWFFPENAKKPKDGRQRENKVQKTKQEKYRFFMPYIIGSIHSDEQLESLSEEEREVYEIDLLYEGGFFSQVRERAELLLQKTDNDYVKLALLYVLPINCMYLQDFESMGRYTLRFKLLCEKIEDHREIVDFTREEFDSEISSIIDSSKSFNAESYLDCEMDFLPCISCMKLIYEYVNMLTGNGPDPDVESYEIILRLMEADGYFYNSMLMHLSLSIYYSIKDKEDKSFWHLNKAVEIAVKHNAFYSLAYSLNYDSEITKKVFSQYPPQLMERFKALYTVFSEARANYRRYIGNSEVNLYTGGEDFNLVLCCIKNYSIEEMAYVFDMSVSGVKKRLSSLYKKFRVKNKTELTQKCLASILEMKK